jgi:ribosomal protein S12 methylthiotransferase
MLRPSNGERYLEIIDDFRRRVPGITMRSTFIVGFPGETDEHVAYLEEWLGRAKLDRVGFFGYSQEEGTPGAELANQVPAKEIRRRLLRLREAARIASEEQRRTRVGTVVKVLVEEQRRLRPGSPLRASLGGATNVLIGRSAGEAPGVDGVIAFVGVAEVGSFVDVELTGTTAFDFVGRHVHAYAVAS